MRIEDYIKNFKRIGFKIIPCPRCNKWFTNMTKLKAHYKKCEDFSLTIKNLDQISELEKVFDKRFLKKWGMIVLDKWIDAFREETLETCDELMDNCDEPIEPIFDRHELD